MHLCFYPFCKHTKGVFCLILICLFFLAEKSVASQLDDSMVTINSVSRVQLDANLALLSVPTIGVSVMLNKDLFSKKIYYVRLSNSNLVQIAKGAEFLHFCPTLSFGMLVGYLEANVGGMVLVGDGGAFPYFNLGLRSKSPLKHWRVGIGFPELFYAGFQLNLGDVMQKSVPRSEIRRLNTPKAENKPFSNRLNAVLLLGSKNVPGLQLNYKLSNLKSGLGAIFIQGQVGKFIDIRSYSYTKYNLCYALKVGLIKSNLDMGLGLCYKSSSTFFLSQSHFLPAFHLGYISNYNHGWAIKMGAACPEFVYVGLCRKFL